MAGQRENDEVERDIAEAGKIVGRLRPSHRIVHLWRDLEACLENIRKIEFLLGYAPERWGVAAEIDHEAVQTQLMDARSALGSLALTLADEAEDAS